MLIRYIKNAPGATAGTVRDVEGRYAIPLIDLGYAVRHVPSIKRAPIVPQKIEPAAVFAEAPTTADASAAPEKKRQYKRRDLQAEK